MKLTSKSILAVGSALALSSGASAQVPATPTAQSPVSLGAIPDEYICAFNGRMDPRNVRAEARRIVEGQAGQLRFVYQNSIRGFAARLPSGAAQRIKAQNPSIVLCENDQVVRALAQRAAAKPGSGAAPSQGWPWGVARVNPGKVQFTSTTARAWVIDSGIDLDHPDLNVDTVRSRSFLQNTNPDDQNGHGTHVAGTIAAKDNGLGVIGVAAGAPVVAVRVLDRRGSGTISGVVAGVDYVGAAALSGDVANMSLGGGVSSILDAAVVAAAEKGIRFTIAAGNSGEHANNSSPGRVNGLNVYTVSAFAKGDTWASFSNYGNPPVDYGEPGVGIPSTYKDGGYETLSGTSMAAPHLAGILLLGPVRTDGAVQGDPDGKPDPIGAH